MNKEHILRNPKERNAKKNDIIRWNFYLNQGEGKKGNFNITMVFYIKNYRPEMTTLETAI